MLIQNNDSFYCQLNSKLWDEFIKSFIILNLLNNVSNFNITNLYTIYWDTCNFGFNNDMKTGYVIAYIWRPSSQNEFIPYQISSELTHLGSEDSIYILLVNLCYWIFHSQWKILPSNISALKGLQVKILNDLLKDN